MQELGLQISATGLLFLVVSFAIASHSGVIAAGNQVKLAVRSLALVSAVSLVTGLLLAIWSW
jgi:hypothetical protein